MNKINTDLYKNLDYDCGLYVNELISADSIVDSYIMISTIDNLKLRQERVKYVYEQLMLMNKNNSYNIYAIYTGKKACIFISGFKKITSEMSTLMIDYKISPELISDVYGIYYYQCHAVLGLDDILEN